MEIINMSSPNSETLITCKKENIINKKSITDIKTYKKFEIEYTNDERRLNEMLVLNSGSSDLFLEKLIFLGLINPFNSYLEGGNEILPPIFSRKYKHVLQFMSEDKAVYFADLSIKKYSDLIKKIKDKTKLEILNDGLNKLKNYNIKYLNLSLESFDKENGIYGGVFDREYKINNENLKEYRYYHYLKDNKADSSVIDDMCNLLEEFVSINGKFYESIGDDNQLDLFNENGNSIAHITGLKYNKELKEHIKTLSI